MFAKIFWSVLLIGAGLGFIVYTEPIKRFTGSFDFAEKWFGSGGTYTFLKIVGLILMIGTFLWITGTIDRIIPNFLKSSLD
jgi:hypothetical protein